MRALSRKFVPERVPSRIHDKKYLFTIIWSIDKFYFVNIMPEHSKFNSEYFVNNIIIPLHDIIYHNVKKVLEINMYYT